MSSVDFARLPAHGATWDDLDPFEFERVRRLVADSGDRADRVLVTLADQELTRALGLEVPDSEVSTGGLLLVVSRCHMGGAGGALQMWTS